MVLLFPFVSNQLKPKIEAQNRKILIFDFQQDHITIIIYIEYSTYDLLFSLGYLYQLGFS